MQQKVAIYARGASSETDIEGQLRECHEYAKLHDYDVVLILSGIGSGIDPSLPLLVSLFEAASSGKINVVIVSRLDRISRDSTILAAFMLHMDRCSVQIEIVHDEGKMMEAWGYINEIASLAGESEEDEEDLDADIRL